jgi:hypothetical protein
VPPPRLQILGPPLTGGPGQIAPFAPPPPPPPPLRGPGLLRSLAQARKIRKCSFTIYRWLLIDTMNFRIVSRKEMKNLDVVLVLFTTVNQTFSRLACMVFLCDVRATMLEGNISMQQSRRN